MSPCVRGCTHWRRHKSECPVEDRQAGAWMPWMPNSDYAAVAWDGFDNPAEMMREHHIEWLCDADRRARNYGRNSWGMAELQQNIHITKRGTLEIWHACNGCAPRKALHGCLCEQCHLRLAGWLGGGPGALAWAYGWVAPDLEPGQNIAPQQNKGKRGKPAPPTALNLHTHVLRQDIAQHLGSWLAMVTELFNLVGPDWWSWREVHRQHPHNQDEVNDAARYLLTWLDRVETVGDYVTAIYAEAESLMRRVAAMAPWEPHQQRMKGLSCPECEREALCLIEGDEHLTCRRCGTLVHRAKYDRWAFMIASEKEKVG